MDKEKLYLYQCFSEGIAFIIAIYEICRTGRKKTTRKKF